MPEVRQDVLPLPPELRHRAEKSSCRELLWLLENYRSAERETLAKIIYE